WFGTKDHPSLLHQLLDFPEQCRTHGFQLWKNEDLIRKTVGQSETAVFQRQSVEDDLGIDIVKGIPFRQGWILHPGHFRGVLTNEIGDIRYVTPLLQHEVAALKVGDKSIHVIVPGVEPVKFVAKPGIYTGSLVLIGLVDEKVQQGIVDPFRKKAIPSLLEHGRVARKRFSGRRKRLR